jgi:hypothetical protein
MHQHTCGFPCQPPCNWQVSCLKATAASYTLWHAVKSNGRHLRSDSDGTEPGPYAPPPPEYGSSTTHGCETAPDPNTHTADQPMDVAFLLTQPLPVQPGFRGAECSGQDQAPARVATSASPNTQRAAAKAAPNNAHRLPCCSGRGTKRCPHTQQHVPTPQLDALVRIHHIPQPRASCRRACGKAKQCKIQRPKCCCCHSLLLPPAAYQQLLSSTTIITTCAKSLGGISRYTDIHGQGAPGAAATPASQHMCGSSVYTAAGWCSAPVVVKPAPASCLPGGYAAAAAVHT